MLLSSAPGIRPSFGRVSAASIFFAGRRPWAAVDGGGVGGDGGDGVASVVFLGASSHVYDDDDGYAASRRRFRLFIVAF